MKTVSLEVESKPSTQRGCTPWLLISCAVLTLTTGSVFGWGIGAPAMYDHYTEVFFKGENPCKLDEKLDITSQRNTTVTHALDAKIRDVENMNDVSIFDFTNQEQSSEIDANKKKKINFIDELITGIPQTIFSIGGLIGSLTGATWLYLFDRKKTIFVNFIFTFSSSLCVLLSYLFQNVWLFYAGRLLLGYQGGMACVVTPPYIAEIASQRVRGLAGTIFRLTLSFGILIAQLIGMPFIAGNCTSWSWGLAIVFLLPFFGMFVMIFIPNSPTQMIATYHNEEQAIEDLKRLRGTSHVQADLDLIRQEVQGQSGGHGSKHLSLAQVIASKRYRWPLLTTVVLQVSQITAGINVVFYYSSKMYASAGIPASLIPYSNMGLGIFNLIATLVSLLIIDRVGRRPLILYPMMVMAVVFALLTVLVEFNERLNSERLSLVAVILTSIFIICFSMGLGPIPFFYGSEVCRPEARDSIQSLGFTLANLVNALLSLFFPMLNSMLGGYVFLILFFLILFSVVFLWFKMPETKNSTIEESEKFWNIQLHPQNQSLLASSVNA